MPEDFDIVVPHFRRAMERWPDAQTLGNHYTAVVDSYQSNQHGLIEAAKSFVECVCLTILAEYGGTPPSSNPSMTEILIETLSLLGLRNSRGASGLDRVLSAYNKLADALTAMRNNHGPVAHGKDGFLDALTANHIRTYLLAADTLLALLLAALEGTEPDLQCTREPYEQFAHLHERIDRSVAVESSVEYEEDDSPVLVVGLKTDSLPDGVELRIEPSRLLYAADRAAYVELLKASLAQVTAATAGVGTEAKEGLPSVWAKEAVPPSELVPAYTGALSPLRDRLQEYLAGLGLSEPPTVPASANLIDSLLGTAEANMGMDWRDRDVLQARMKVALRRILVEFGIAAGDAKERAEQLVTWFKTQMAGSSSDTEETAGEG